MGEGRPEWPWGRLAALTVVSHHEYHRVMRIAIDGAGRIVVPKSLRERFNLVAGTELEIEARGEFLQICRTGAEPALLKKKGILVHHGGERANLDVTAFIRAERDSRSRRILPEGAG